MLKRTMRSIRRRLLKVDWIKREVEAYKQEQEKQRDRENWAKIMHGGRSVRDTEKPNPYKTLAIVTDDDLIVTHMAGRVVGQEHVTPVFIDSTNWG